MIKNASRSDLAKLKEDMIKTEQALEVRRSMPGDWAEPRVEFNRRPRNRDNTVKTRRDAIRDVTGR